MIKEMMIVAAIMIGMFIAPIILEVLMNLVGIAFKKIKKPITQKIKALIKKNSKERTESYWTKMEK